MSMNINIKKPETAELEKLKVSSWPLWTKEISEFDWFYDNTEECYLLEGTVTVTTEHEEVTFGKGDFVTFPKGLSCTWKISEPVKKHYNFTD